MKSYMKSAGAGLLIGAAVTIGAIIGATCATLLGAVGTFVAYASGVGAAGSGACAIHALDCKIDRKGTFLLSAGATALGLAVAFSAAAGHNIYERDARVKNAGSLFHKKVIEICKKTGVQSLKVTDLEVSVSCARSPS